MELDVLYHPIRMKQAVFDQFLSGFDKVLGGKSRAECKLLSAASVCTVYQNHTKACAGYIEGKQSYVLCVLLCACVTCVRVT
jgi:hypothetical protein